MRLPVSQPREHDFGAMTSMIDVVLFLLMFFVVTGGGQMQELLLPAKLAPQGAVAAGAPAANRAPSTVDIWLKLSLSPDAQQTVVDMNGTVYADRELLKTQLRALAELGPENPVILDVAPATPVGDVVDVYDVCQSAGFQSINFAAKAAP
jgi:biopolymer transport protein ExbD